MIAPFALKGFKRHMKQFKTSLLMGVMLATSVVTSACYSNVAVGYRAHDPYHNDYHRWDDGEVRYYNQWVVETHRPSGLDYRRMKRQEQRDYWNWRHSH